MSNLEYHIKLNERKKELEEALIDLNHDSDDVDQLMEQLIYIPSHMVYGVISYLLHGIKPGGFLGAVLSNQLYESYVKADEDNKLSMHRWQRLLMYMPAGSWGSPSDFGLWMARGGLKGIEAEQERGKLEHQAELRRDG